MDQRPVTSVRLINSFGISVDGREIDRLRTRKTEALFAWLALHRGKAFGRDELVERFWAGEDEVAARRKLRLALHSIRAAVGDSLESVRDKVRLVNLEVDALDTDAEGELLPDLDFEWLSPFRATHALRVEDRLHGRLAKQTRDEQWEEATSSLYSLIETDPYEPRWYEELFAVLQRRGRRNEARALAGIARSLLGDELPAALAASASAGLSPRRSFVGHSRVLSELAELLLGDHEPVAAVLLGPGGIGKTRLAQEIAALAGREEIETRVVRLLGRSSLEEVRLEVLEALPSPFEPDNLPPTLLVLDNCEQLEQGAVAWISTLVQPGSSVRLLLTSQKPLVGLGAEAFVLRPLSVPSGVDLLAASRSEACTLFALQADIDLDEANAPLVAAICRKMGGVPLAIRHAAARLSSTSLQGLLDSLGDLLGSDRAGSERHRSVSACVRWSLGLLSEEQRASLRVIAWFSSGFLQATATEAGARDEDWDALVQLNWVSKRSGSDSYEILPPFREALLKVPGDDGAVALRLLARWKTLIEEHLSTRYASVVSELAVHLDDVTRLFHTQLEKGCLEEAAALFVGIHHVGMRSGKLASAHVEALKFEAAVPAERIREFPSAWNNVGALAFVRRDFERAERFYNLTLTCGNERLSGVAYANLGILATARKQYALGAELMERSLDEAGLSVRTRASRRVNLSECYMAQGRFEDAESLLRLEIEALEGQAEERAYHTLAMLSMGELEIVRGSFLAARTWVERAEAAYVEQNERWRVHECAILLALINAEARDMEGLKESLRTLLGSDADVNSLVLGFGLSLRASGAVDLAKPFLEAIDWSKASVWAVTRFGSDPGAKGTTDGLQLWRHRAEKAMKRL